MAEEHPNIVIGPLTLEWRQHELGRESRYIGQLAMTTFTIEHMHSGRWFWHVDIADQDVFDSSETLEDATAGIRGFLTALGIIHE